MDKLEKSNIVVIVGKQGSGKSVLALETAARVAKDGTPIILLMDASSDFVDVVNCSDHQLVILEDVFGKKNPQFKEDIDAKILQKVNVCLQQKRTQIIITSRQLFGHTLENIIQNILVRNPVEIIVNLDTRDKITPEEKTTMLKRYMRIYKREAPNTNILYSAVERFFPGSTCKSKGKGKQEIDDVFFTAVSKIEPALGFPLTCHQFCLKEEFIELGINFFKNPAVAILDDINAIRKSGKHNENQAYEYIILVYILFKSDLDLRNVDLNLCQNILNATYSRKQLNCEIEDIRDAVDDLAKSYIVFDYETSKHVFKFESFREMVAISFGSFSKRSTYLLVQHCSWNVLMNFARPFSYKADQAEHIINIDPSLYMKLLLRYKVEIFHSNIQKLAKAFFPSLQTSSFKQLIAYLINNTKLDETFATEISRMFVLDNHNFQLYYDTLEKIIRKEISRTTFLSLDKHKNSFVHYWIVENFNNKSELFRTIYEEIPELMSIDNIYGHTPVHFAIYTGHFAIIKDNFYQWFDNFSQLYDPILFADANGCYKVIRWFSSASVYSILRKITYSCTKKGPLNHLSQGVYMVNLSNEIYKLVLSTKTEIYDNISSLSIKIESYEMQFNENRTKLYERMVFKIVCNNEKQRILSDIYEELDNDLFGRKRVDIWFKLISRFEELLNVEFLFVPSGKIRFCEKSMLNTSQLYWIKKRFWNFDYEPFN